MASCRLLIIQILLLESGLIFGEGMEERKEKKQALSTGIKTLFPKQVGKLSDSMPDWALDKRKEQLKNPFLPGKYLRHFSINILSTDCLLTAAEPGPELHQTDWSPAEGANDVAE